MKRIELICGVIMTIAILFACSGKTISKAPTQRLGSDEWTQNIVSIDTATAAISRYANWCNNVVGAILNGNHFPPPVGTNTAPIQSFLITWCDLAGVLQPTLSLSSFSTSLTYTAARAYIGLDASLGFHLYFTPDSSSIDVILTSPTFPTGYVFDLTTPCPNTCNPLNSNSQLNLAFANTFTAGSTTPTVEIVR